MLALGMIYGWLGIGFGLTLLVASPDWLRNVDVVGMKVGCTTGSRLLS